MPKLNTSSIPVLLCDFYKISHKNQYPKGTEIIYSTLTPRTNKYAPKVNGNSIDFVVVLGFQYLIQKYLIEFFNENFFNRDKDLVVNQYVDFVKNHLGSDDKGEHIAELHDLGYLPLKIKAIQEGTKVGIKVPVLTIENTNPKFYWLTNYFETLISCSTWQPMTSATIAKAYHNIVSDYSAITCDNDDHVQFQCHDFSMRGMSSLESAELSGLGHLVSFKGTDTIPAITAARHYYDASGLVGTSIPATEHSVMSSHGLNEYETFKYLISEAYPTGLISIVSDTYDFWGNIKETLPKLKNTILSRDGKVVIRPDSGDPVDIICGTFDYLKIDSEKDLNQFNQKGNYPKYIKIGKDFKVLKDVLVEGNPHFMTHTPIYEPVNLNLSLEEKGLIESLWDIFGGIVNLKGFRVLNEKIGAIYGDSITLERAELILNKLMKKGYASSNIVFGVGSFTYQMNTRDTFGFAIKATHAVINGEQKQIFKDPKTDSGMKKSQRGRVKVISETEFIDQLSIGEDEDGLLQTIFEDGKLVKRYNWNQVVNKALD